MTNAVFLITLSAEFLTTIFVVVSIFLPEKRIWPPGKPNGWGQYAMLTLFNLSAAGVFLVGVLDWGSFSLPGWMRVLVGIPLWLAGITLGLWAMISTAGANGALIERGPYRFSRNPQYVGFILALTGWALVTDSALTIGVALAGCLPLLLVPFAEEPSLLEKYGALYAEYKRSVPRFFFFV
jgi:protein-S-isoprenylcysteine O-methyltransferase Ste14